MAPVDGHVAVPHFDRFIGASAVGRRFAERSRRRLHGLSVLGLDEATALVVQGGRARVLGAGAVTIGGASSWRVHSPGQEVHIDLGVSGSASRIVAA